MSITQNLFDALLHVRYGDRPLLLWADGLCIDQENTEERNHQVGMLHQIYSQAHVISWLGTYDQTDLTAMADYVSLTARVKTSVIRSAEAATMDHFNICRAAVAKYEELFDSLNRPQIPDMSHVLDAEYFTRVWVVQEIFLGKSVTCQLGTQRISVAALVASLEFWNVQSRIDVGQRLENIVNHYLAPSLLGHWDVLQDGALTQDVAVVHGFGAKQCSDLRDHVYGLSALFENPSEYPIDYSLSVEEVFCDFAVHCFESVDDLSSIFCFYRGIMQRKYTLPPETSSVADNTFVRSSKNDEVALPSWCPLWTAQTSSMTRYLTGGFHKAPWNASGHRRPRLNRPSTFAITLEGCVMSKVTWCSTNTADSPHSVRALITEIVEYLLSRPQHASSTDVLQSCNLASLLLSTLGLLAWNPYLHLEHYIFAWFHRSLPRRTQTLLEKLEFEDRVRKLLFPVYLHEEVPDLFHSAHMEIDTRVLRGDYGKIAYEISEQIFTASCGCCLFVTENGMVGTGLPGMMAGDVSCILFGGSVPYILRPTEIEGQYLLVGECYVEGLMAGEAMGMGLQEQKFTLV